jgi:hypothetical protein
LPAFKSAAEFADRRLRTPCFGLQNNNAFGTATAYLLRSGQKTKEKIMLRQLIITGAVAMGLLFSAGASAQAARPKKTQDYGIRGQYGYIHPRYEQPDRPIDVWGTRSYYGHWNPRNYPNIPYPDYSGGLFYGNSAFGLYGNSGYVSPYWGMDFVYFPTY